MKKIGLRYNFVKLIPSYCVLLFPLLLCESAPAISLQYKLAMLGYDDKEITEIISRRQSLRAINSNYKKRVLGYPAESRSSASFIGGDTGRVSPRVIFQPSISKDLFSTGVKGLNPDTKNRLLAEAIPYLTIIKDAATRNKLVESLILAVIKVESGFDSRAVSRKGAMGLMQLMPDTADDLGLTDPFDPVQNISGGAKYLSDCMKTFKSIGLALAAYNAGPSKVAKLKGCP